MERTTTSSKTNAQKMAMLFGAVFTLVGVAGFIPGLTTDYDLLGEMDQPGAKLLGIFAVNWLHNIVHLLFGIAGLVMARRHDTARNYLIGGGIIYLVLWLYGLVIDHDSTANFVALNTADNWLHLLLGLGLLGSGLIFGKTTGASRGSGYQDAHRRAS